MNALRYKIVLVLCMLGLYPNLPFGYNPKDKTSTQFKKYTQGATDEIAWIDSVYKTMSLEEKIGQLFMVPAFGREDGGQDIEMQNLITNYHIGGVIFMKGDPSTQVMLANRYQNYAKIPLAIAQDAEWGVAMRLQNVVKFPKNMALGAIRNDSLLYELGTMMGQQCKQVGVQINFAPVVDVNNNPNNPVINDRSFGENKYNVVRKAWMLSKGMIDQHILPCAKHFPGHGDTDKDSHKEMPSILHNRARLDTMELYPFYRLAEYGMPSIMVAHLSVPALDPTPNQPSTLSSKIITDLLRKQMNYDGLVFTDALNMEGVAKYYPSGEVEVKAFKAGNDVLLYSKDVPVAIGKMKQAINSGEIEANRLEESVKRILRAKFRLNLTKRIYAPVGSTIGMLNSAEAQRLKKKLYEAAVTMPKNEGNLIPLGALESMSIAYIQVGGTQGNTFTRTLQKYAGIKVFNLPQNPTTTQINNTIKSLRAYNTVILGMFDVSKKSSENFGISVLVSDMANKIAALSNTKLITCVFGSPYALKNFGREKAVLVGYDDDVDAQQAVASAIFGGLTIDGSLPVTASPQFKEGMGEIVPYITRFGFALPEEMGMSSYVLNKIDSLAKSVVQMRIVPGFAVAVLRGDKIVWEKGYGKTDFSAAGDSIDPLVHTYDLASVTKICATTLIAMQMYEQGNLDLDRTIGEYLPEFQNSNKSYLTVRELLQHSSGLKAWIPFYLTTYSDPAKTRLRTDLYAFSRSDKFSIEVAPNLFLRSDYKDSIWQVIKNSDLGPRNHLVYSDLSMIILGKIIESQVGTTLEDYACTHFYQPMGMASTSYNPGQKGTAFACPPTEIDDEWRKCVVKGYVHDPAAAILGGVSGNAGLFSSVYDVCKLLYMVKSGGQYGQHVFLEPQTIKKFSSKQVDFSRRGLGFDKPNSDAERSGQVSPYASEQAYGHLGFTGNSVWIDPEYDLVFVFLSNRTYPSAKDKNFNRKHVRREVMDLVYESMLKKNVGKKRI